MHLQCFTKIYTHYSMFLSLSLNERFCSDHWIERLTVYNYSSVNEISRNRKPF
jgi:hypothetical protein